MARVRRDGEHIVLRIKAGNEAGGFARFLVAAAEAIRLGHIPPANPNTHVSPDVAAMQLRQLADQVNGVNS